MSEHMWLYDGTEPSTVCIRCGLTRAEAPMAGGGQQAFAPCDGCYNTHLAVDLPRSPKRSAQREYAFQVCAIAYLRKVLVPPVEAFAIINESELTQNARARAKSRGAIPGVSDIIAMQMGRVILIELKWGSNKPSDAQLAFKVRMAACDIPVVFCWTCEQIFEALQREQFHLHGNAWNLASEYQERAEASVRRAEMRAQKPHDKQRMERPTQSRIKRMHATGIWSKP